MKTNKIYLTLLLSLIMVIVANGQITLPNANKPLIEVDNNAPSLMPLMNDIYNGGYSEVWLKSKDISDFDIEGFYKRAYQKLSMGYLNEAIADLNKAIEGNNQFAEAWSLRGICKLDLNDLTGAKFDIDTALMLDSTLALSWNALGSICLNLNNNNEAETYFLKAYKIDPNYTFTLYNLGSLYLKTGNFKLSELYFKKALKIEPSYTAAQLQLAIGYAYNNKPRKALSIINQVIYADSTNKTALYYKVANLLMLNKHNKAYPIIVQLLMIDSLNPQLLVEAGKIELRKGLYNKAIEHLAKANFVRNQLTGAHKVGNYYNNELNDIVISMWLMKRSFTNTQFETMCKAVKFIMEGKAQKAEKVIYKTGKDVIPPVLEIYVRLAIYAKSQYVARRVKITELFQSQIADLLNYNPSLKYMHALKAEEAGNTDASIVYLSEALRADPEYAFAYNARGWLYMQRKRYSLAMLDFDNAIKNYPMFDIAYKNRGILQAATGNDSLAIIDFKKALFLNPNELELYIDISLAYARANKPDSALYFIKQGLKIAPNTPEFIETIASINMHFGKPDSAYNNYSGLIKAYPQNAYFYYQRGNICFDNNKLDSAISDFKQAILIEPKFVTPYIRLAHVYQYAKKNYPQAILVYSKVLQIEPSNIWALTDRGTLYVEINKIDSAEADLSNAIKSDSAQSVAYGNLGWVKYLKGKYSESITMSEKAILLDSTAIYAMYNKALATLCLGNIQQATVLYEQTAKFDFRKNKKIDDGAINDIKKLIKEGIMTFEAQNILQNILERKVD